MEFCSLLYLSRATWYGRHVTIAIIILATGGKDKSDFSTILFIKLGNLVQILTLIIALCLEVFYQVHAS